MYGVNACPNPEEPPPDLPAPKTLLVDTSRNNRVGEFQGVAGCYWALRPIGGGREWEADPRHVRPAPPTEQLRSHTARMNTRSRGEAR
ncbi:hypothetical protein [Streptomyces sp. NPDC057554]|uniref:hypothetical protein n=1 Tax=Streptomyces sp. NPDC057554 TaxID=3350538 RepID=UPI00369D1709